MKARLIARYGPDRGTEAEIVGEATIGRGLDCTVQLRSPEVSQRHARIRFDADLGGYLLEDLDSLNGTRLDGAKVDRPERLGRLHVVSFGGVSEFFFVELDRGAEAPADSLAGDSPDAAAGTPAAPDRAAAEGRRTQIDADAPALPAVLRQEEGGGARGTRVEEAPPKLPQVLAAGMPPASEPAPAFALAVDEPEPRRFPLVEGQNLVGRSGRAAVRLQARGLSRRHAVLRVAGGRVWIRDAGSRNHTYVGDRQVEGEVELRPGAEISFGQLRARLVGAGEGEDEAEGDGRS